MFSGTSSYTQKAQNWTTKTIARFAKKTQLLPTLNQAIADLAIADHSYAGVCQVPISQIVGTASEARSRDFDAEFRLINKHSQSRLEEVRKARQQMCEMPPVSLVAVGDKYYVQDGHHRVSIFRDCEEATIAAHVTVLVLQ